MKDAYNLRQQDFDSLLELFSDDREDAGRAYEQLRSGLIRFFRFRGCCDPEALADETFDRVAAKLASYDRTKAAPTGYVYGFARNILRESRRTKEQQLEIEDWNAVPMGNSPVMDPEDEALERLTLCLERFNEHDRRLILEYYSREHHEKIVLRRQLASDLDCSTAALHTKVFRLKSRLRACMNAGA